MLKTVNPIPNTDAKIEMINPTTGISLTNHKNAVTNKANNTTIGLDSFLNFLVTIFAT